MNRIDSQFSISPLNPDHLAIALDVVWRSFSEFVMPDYEPKGIAEFKKFIEIESIAAKINSGEQIMWTYCYGQDIVGVISCGPKNHISLLFVDKAHPSKRNRRHAY